MKKKDQQSTYRILIEANKLLMPGNDGVKRYLTTLLNVLQYADPLNPSQFEIDLYVQGRSPFALGKASVLLDSHSQQVNTLEKQIASIKEQAPIEVRLLQVKTSIRKALPAFVYRWCKRIYVALPIRFLLDYLRQLLAWRDAQRLKKVFAQYDLIHIPLPQNVHYLAGVEGNFLVTIHDLSHFHFPEFHTSDNRSRTESGMDWIVKKQAHILAVSEATKVDILQVYPLPAAQIHVVYPSYDAALFFPQSDQAHLRNILKKYGLPNRPFFLALSTLEPRKNLINMLKAFSDLSAETETEEMAFFVCGKTGWKMEDFQKQAWTANENIFFPGFIAEEDLPILYAHALALCYVSFYEGFGLPPLEAMACGTTVIYGHNSALTEVIADAGLPADPNDVAAIKRQMASVFHDEGLRTSLERKALKRAAFFSEKKMATAMLKVYQRILATLVR
ncbi:MAG: glycosyltransferase family 1 protein [Bacteroidota bacterium]